MPRRLVPTSGQKRNFVIHFIVFAIAVVAMVLIHKKQGEDGWAYPWHAWIIAAWSLAILGHFCAVFRSYEDKCYDEYRRQAN